HVAGDIGDGGEFAKGQTKIRREKLGKIPCRDAEDVTGRHWKNLAGVHRHQRSGVPIDGQGPVTLQFQIEKSARPQAKLLAIEIDCEVAPPAVLPSAALAAVDHALPNLGDVQIDGDAFLSPFIAQPAPVAGEGRARSEIASVWIFRRRILCSNLYVERNSEHSRTVIVIVNFFIAVILLFSFSF